MAFYVLDENNNKIEAYDKQGFLAFLEDAIANHTLEGIASDSAFVDKLKCCVGGGTHKVAFVTQAVYNQLQADGQLIPNAYYFVTDDTTSEDIEQALNDINVQIEDLDNRTQRIINEITLAGTEGGSVNLEVGTYVIETNRESFVLCIGERSTANPTATPFHSTASLNYDAASISVIEYYKDWVTPTNSKMTLKHRNFSTGNFSVDSSTLVAKYYKL